MQSKSLKSIQYILNKKIRKYIKQFGGGPKQGSEEWHKIKKITIGGSEVAVVIGSNPFKNVKSLIGEKIGLAQFKFCGNTATKWGNLFESVTEKFTKKVLAMEESIHTDIGSIEGPIERQRYSPDGIGCVKLLNSDDNYEYFIILFEFKSPYSSIPDGNIPKYYVPQLQTGMMTINIVESSIFVNNCYRKCSFEDLNFKPVYDNIYHDKDLNKTKKSQKLDTVYACGIIYFYQTEDQYIENMEVYKNINQIDENNIDACFEINDCEDISADAREILMQEEDSQPIDFGKSDKSQTDQMLELFDTKKIHAFYGDVLMSGDVNNLPFLNAHKIHHDIDKIKFKKKFTKEYNTFIEYCEDSSLIPVGYLPWKLMKSDIISEEYNENWLDDIKPCVTDTIAKIDHILESDNVTDSFNEMFGESVAISEKKMFSDIMSIEM